MQMYVEMTMREVRTSFITASEEETRNTLIKVFGDKMDLFSGYTKVRLYLDRLPTNPDTVFVSGVQFIK